MRSWTTFALFGGFLVIILAFSFFTQYSGNPTVQTAQRFLDTVNRNDAAAAEKYLDPDSVTIIKAGNSIVRIVFKETNLFDGPFVHNKTAVWGYTELTGLKINPKTEPHVLDQSGLASIQFTNGLQMFLKRSGKDWKVFYITKTVPE